MQKQTIILLIILCFCAHAHAAFEDKRPGARPAALGGAFVALADDDHALQYNPGGLGLLRGFKASLDHAELFSLDDLRYDRAGFALPLKGRYGIGAAYSQFGPDMYRETVTAVGAGVRILEDAAIGIAIHHLGLRIRGYGSSSDWAGSIGFLGTINPFIRVGLNMRNIMATHLGNSGELPEKGLSIGFKVVPKRQFVTLVGFDRELDGEQITYRIGQEVLLAELFNLRFGFHNYPNRLSAGFGISWKGTRFDYGLITHPYLDLQHQFTVGYSWE